MNWRNDVFYQKSDLALIQANAVCTSLHILSSSIDPIWLIARFNLIIPIADLLIEAFWILLVLGVLSKKCNAYL